MVRDFPLTTKLRTLFSMLRKHTGDRMIPKTFLSPHSTPARGTAYGYAAHPLAIEARYLRTASARPSATRLFAVLPSNVDSDSFLYQSIATGRFPEIATAALTTRRCSRNRSIWRGSSVESARIDVSVDYWSNARTTVSPRGVRWNAYVLRLPLTGGADTNRPIDIKKSVSRFMLFNCSRLSPGARCARRSKST